MKNRIKNASLSCFHLLLLFLLLNSCSEPKKAPPSTLFSLVNPDLSGVHFTNQIKENLYFNFLNYSYIYNGGGVAAGDINKDGLPDLYFSSNQGSNKLYLNKGDFTFEDISAKSGVTDENGWTTGVTMIDINNDGWLDIYVCKSGSLEDHKARKNKLFINQTNNTFKENAAAYGLDHFGFSTQAYFFDFDKDADLDMYLVNHRQDFENNTHIDPMVLQNKQSYNSDQLFRNDNGFYSNITLQAGIENKAWGLSASIGDFNNDTLPDVYVANDFLEPDFLYINQGNGTFKDEILKRFDHISTNSMGSDYADINNDLQPDLIVLDMLAEDHIRSKENMANMSTNSFNLLVNSGYHYQYMSNMLQLNNGNGTFSEIAQLAGIAKTDWSWAPLLADFNNDGYKDLFVTNGIKNDLSNQDFRNQMRANIINRKKVSLEQAIGMMPSHKIANYIFRNNKNLTFSNSTRQWGLDTKVNSNGAVYTDLDRDGDLDLVINNQSEKAQIYQNHSLNNWVSFSLQGTANNQNGIGSRLKLYAPGLNQSQSLRVSRGFQSSIGHKIIFGLDTLNRIDSLRVNWPDGVTQLLTEIEINSHIKLYHKNAIKSSAFTQKSTSLFTEIDPDEIGIDYKQKENYFNDFDLQLLLPQKQSEGKNPIIVADVNKDGLDDFFVGNAKDAEAGLWIQDEAGTFKKSNMALFEAEKAFEDTDAAFVDIDNDQDLDLYVASGAYEVPAGSPLLQDRLYINDGNGNFSKNQLLPQMLFNTNCVTTADFDRDGDMDIFLGGGVVPGKYPLAEKSVLLKNNDGRLKDVTKKTINLVSEIKIVNDALFTDYDKDGDADLLLVGEWMPITIFKNVAGQFTKIEPKEFKNTHGWYQTVTEADLDNNGYPDYILGNWGDNNKFHPSQNKPLHIYADYLDENHSFDLVLSKETQGKLLPVRGKECSSQQNPYLQTRVKTFKEFATASLPEIYGKEKLQKAIHFEVYDFKSLIINNIGESNFEIENLPVQAQFSPTLGIEVFDINQDGLLDIFGVGNVNEAEIETVRYDASKNYLLIGGSDGSLEFFADLGYFNKGEARNIKKIIIKGYPHFIILNKNGPLQIIKLQKKER